MPRTPADATLAPWQELRACRQRLCLGQAALARLLGVEKGTMNRWEQGAQPIPELALRLVRVLADGADPSALIVPVPPPTLLMTGIRFGDGARCNWAVRGGCVGDHWRFAASIDRHHYLEAEACEGHIGVAYETIIERLRPAREKRDAGRRRRPRAPQKEGPQDPGR